MPTVTSKDGTKITYSTWGQGPAVILVDGAFCFRQNGPTPKLAPLLAASYTVYAYDRRGRGESADTPPYAVAREIEDLEAMMQAAGGSAYVFGMSSGGALAIRAVAHGLPAKKLAIYEVPFVAVDPTSPQPPTTAIEDINRLVAAGRRSDAVTYFMTRVFGAPAFFITIMKLVARGLWKKNESVAHTLPYDFQIMGDWSVLKETAAVHVPTLLLGGAKAPKQLQSAVKAAAAAIPGATLQMLAGQTHNVSAAVLAPALTAFFK
jgi:pimeloyl-ACP methyl ester carboxylesterase